MSLEYRFLDNKSCVFQLKKNSNFLRNYSEEHFSLVLTNTIICAIIPLM